MTKKRKATYVKRKEEQQELQEQIQALEQQLAALKAQQADGVSQFKELYESVAVNEAMKTAVDQQQLAVANAQSLVSQWLQTQSRNPMGFCIRLGREWTERRETLLSMKDERLARGFRYVTARCQHLDALKPHFSEEKFEDVNGDFCCVRNEVIPFPGVQSMRKVFDAVKFTLDTLEISISEQLGHITVRDDYDAVEADSFTCNYRLSSGIDSGVTTELNAVAFGRYVEKPTAISKEPYAVMAIDSVDQDKLHPYHPQECVRKMLNGTVVLVEVPNGVKGQVNTEVEIVMLRSFYVKTCRPEFEVSDAVMKELRNTTTRWGEVVLETVRRIVYAS